MGGVCELRGGDWLKHEEVECRGEGALVASTATTKTYLFKTENASYKITCQIYQRGLSGPTLNTC
jgi:hypothetical protein